MECHASVYPEMLQARTWKGAGSLIMMLSIIMNVVQQQYYVLVVLEVAMHEKVQEHILILSVYMEGKETCSHVLKVLAFNIFSPPRTKIFAKMMIFKDFFKIFVFIKKTSPSSLRITRGQKEQ